MARPKRFNVYTPTRVRVWLRVDPVFDLDFMEEVVRFDVGKRPDWLDAEIADHGMTWEDFLGVDGLIGWPHAQLTWLLTQGIAPGQAFLVEMSKPLYYRCGEYDMETDVEYDANVIQIERWPAARVLKAWRSNVRWYYRDKEG